MNWKSRKVLSVAGGTCFAIAFLANVLLARHAGYPILFVFGVIVFCTFVFPFFVVQLAALGITFSVSGIYKTKPVEAIAGFLILAGMWIAPVAMFAFGYWSID